MVYQTMGGKEPPVAQLVRHVTRPGSVPNLVFCAWVRLPRLLHCFQAWGSNPHAATELLLVPRRSVLSERPLCDLASAHSHSLLQVWHNVALLRLSGVSRASLTRPTTVEHIVRRSPTRVTPIMFRLMRVEGANPHTPSDFRAPSLTAPGPFYPANYSARTLV